MSALFPSVVNPDAPSPVMGAVFDSAWDMGGRMGHQWQYTFRHLAPTHAAYGATFYVPAGSTREQVVQKVRQKLAEFRIQPVRQNMSNRKNQPFLSELYRNPASKNPIEVIGDFEVTANGRVVYQGSNYVTAHNVYRRHKLRGDRVVIKQDGEEVLPYVSENPMRPTSHEKLYLQIVEDSSGMVICRVRSKQTVYEWQAFFTRQEALKWGRERIVELRIQQIANPATVRRLPHSSRYRVRSSGKIKAYGTTHEKAEGQARLLRGVEHGMVPRGKNFALGRKDRLAGKPARSANGAYLDGWYSVRNPREVGVNYGPYRSESGDEFLPPTYRLKYLRFFTSKGRPSKDIEPKFPVEIMAAHDVDIDFKFWGSRRYDVHVAFPGIPEQTLVECIYYEILVGGYSPVVFEHPFKGDVWLTLTGIRGKEIIMKPHGQLQGMPQLPRDWQYFQFVG